jgi:hypothetical protein
MIPLYKIFNAVSDYASATAHATVQAGITGAGAAYEGVKAAVNWVGDIGERCRPTRRIDWHRLG